MKTLLLLLLFLVLCPSFVTAQEFDSITNEIGVTEDKSDSVKENQLNKEDKAKALFQQGLNLMYINHWSEAESKFRRSNALINRNSSLFNLALCLIHQGRARESLEVIEKIDEDPGDPDWANIIRSKRELADRLVTMVGTLRLDVNPAATRITIDDRPIEQSGKTRSVHLDPGDHVVIAMAEGFSNAYFKISIEAGKESRLKINLLPDRVSEQNNRTKKGRIHLSSLIKGNTILTPTLTVSSGESDDNNIGHWIIGGIGCALLVAAGITTLFALEDKAAIDDICPGRRNCNEADQKQLVSLKNREDALFLSSDLLLGSGVTLVGASVVWWLLQNDSRETTVISPRVNLNETKIGLSVNGYL